MAKYIDADEAIEAVEAIWEEYRTPILNGDVRLHFTEAVLIGSEVKAIIDGATKGIKCVPAADVVEVVRCAECKYWDRSVLEHQANDFREWDEAECGMLAERDPYHEVDHYTEEDDFCSRGERKDG